MPCNDRTGPMGDGPKTGRGTGPCGGGKGRGAGKAWAEVPDAVWAKAWAEVPDAVWA